MRNFTLRGKKLWLYAAIFLTPTSLALYFLLKVLFCGTFHVEEYHFPFAHSQEWQLSPLSQSEQQLCREILSQSFHYLGEGGQMIAFSSDDGEYVLKLFKFNRFCPSPAVEVLERLSLFRSYCQRHKSKRAKKFIAAFNGCKIAYEKLRYQSGIIALELNGSDSDLQLSLIDKAGIQHQLPMAKLSYLLQERATLLSETLAQLLDDHNLPKAKFRIAQLFDLYAEEYKRGIFDADHGIMHNIGCRGERVIQIDSGRLTADHHTSNPKFQRVELEKIATKMALWLKRHYPHYAAELIESVDRQKIRVFSELQANL